MKKRVRYSVFFSRVSTGGYSAFFPALPEITVWYPTLAQCRKAAREALEIHLEGLKALGENPPREEIVRGSLRVEVG